MTIEEIKELRRRLSFKGQSLDPNSRFYLLFRHFPYERRQQMEGKALLAWDYYEVAEILGWFLEDVTGKKQPKTDDLNGYGGWKKAAYGVAPEEIDYDSGNILRRLLQEYTVDPVYKVLLIVEGESEEIFIRAWCDIHHLDLSLFGIQLLVLDGLDDLKTKRPRQAAQQARADHAAVIVVADNDAGHDASGDLQRWKDEGLLDSIFQVSDLYGLNSPIGGLVWPSSFEEDNFTLDELLEAWQRFIADKRPGLAVNAITVKATVEATRRNPPLDRNGVPEQCDSWIKAMELANRQLRYSRVKKTDIAEYLAQIIKDRENHIVRIIRNCIGISVRATNYGPPHSSGGFGYPIEQPSAPSE